MFEQKNNEFFMAIDCGAKECGFSVVICGIHVGSGTEKHSRYRFISPTDSIMQSGGAKSRCSPHIGSQFDKGSNDFLVPIATRIYKRRYATKENAVYISAKRMKNSDDVAMPFLCRPMNQTISAFIIAVVWI